MKVLLTNCLMRPQVFTLLEKETFRLTARGTEGFKKEIEKEKLSEEVKKAIANNLVVMTDIDPKEEVSAETTETPTVEEKPAVVTKPTIKKINQSKEE